MLSKNFPTNGFARCVPQYRERWRNCHTLHALCFSRLRIELTRQVLPWLYAACKRGAAMQSRLSAALPLYNTATNPPSVREGEGLMDELIARLVANVGVDRAAAEKACGIIFEFLREEGPPDKVQALLARVPGAEALANAQEAEGGGMFAMGGIMGAGTKMMSAGLSMAQVQAVTREVIAYAREKAGEDAV